MPTEDLIDDEELLEAPKSGTGSSSVLAGLAFFAALAALAMTALLWWQTSETESDPGVDFAQRIDQLAGAGNRRDQVLEQLSQRLDRVEARPQGTGQAAVAEQLAETRRTLEQQLESQQAYTNSLQQAIEALQARLIAAESNIAAASPTRTDLPTNLDLAGVEYLLRLAPERLALFYDVNAADQALAMADARLAAMDNPLYIGLRRQIAEARRALAEFDLPNMVELSATLDTLQQTVSGLVFAGEGIGPDTAVSPGPASSETGWWPRLKASLASLVTVRRSAADDVSRLSLEDKDMLRQGLWMQLEEARLALARHDPVGWQAALERTERVMERWFEPSNSAFETMQEGLNALSAVEISPEVPDISGPWTQLQLLRRTQAVPSAPPVPETALPEKSSAEPAVPEPGPAISTAIPQPDDGAGDSGVDAADGPDAVQAEGATPDEGQAEENS